MIEYPSILPSNKAPFHPCIAFEKLDGSNIRAYWNRKRGFHIFGTRRQMINEDTEMFGQVIPLFRATLEKELSDMLTKNFLNKRVAIFSEWFGEKSFAGSHLQDDPKKLVPFDIWIPKQGFIQPREFLKLMGKTTLQIPKVVYEGNFNKKLIQDVRVGKYDVVEGIVAKGTHKKRNWMVKVKTNEYLVRLKTEKPHVWDRYWE